MGKPGEMYALPRGREATWVDEVRALGFEVDDRSQQLSNLEKKQICFVGYLAKDGKKRIVEVIIWDDAIHILVVQYADREDSKLFARTLGTIFNPAPDLSAKARTK